MTFIDITSILKLPDLQPIVFGQESNNLPEGTANSSKFCRTFKEAMHLFFLETP